MHPNHLRRDNLRGQPERQLSEQARRRRSTAASSPARSGCPRSTTTPPGSAPTRSAAPGSRTTWSIPRHRRPWREQFRLAAFTPDEFFSDTCTTRTSTGPSPAGPPTIAPPPGFPPGRTAGLDFISRDGHRPVPPGGVSRSSAPPGPASSSTTGPPSSSTPDDASATASYGLTRTSGPKSIAGVQYGKDNDRPERRRFGKPRARVAPRSPRARILNARRGDHHRDHARLLRLAAVRLQGPALPDRRGPLRPQQRLRQPFDRVYYPKFAVVLRHLGRGVLPQVRARFASLRLRGRVGRIGPAARRQRRPALLLRPSPPTWTRLDTPGLIASARWATRCSSRSGRQELELGFDAALLNNRVNLEFTYYDKNAQGRPDQPRPGAFGRHRRARFENIGEARNAGLRGGRSIPTSSTAGSSAGT